MCIVQERGGSNMPVLCNIYWFFKQHSPGLEGIYIYIHYLKFSVWHVIVITDILFCKIILIVAKCPFQVTGLMANTKHYFSVYWSIFRRYFIINEAWCLSIIQSSKLDGKKFVVLIWCTGSDWDPLKFGVRIVKERAGVGLACSWVGGFRILGYLEQVGFGSIFIE
jgi:hypothetical protein